MIRNSGTENKGIRGRSVEKGIQGFFLATSRTLIFAEGIYGCSTGKKNRGQKNNFLPPVLKGVEFIKKRRVCIQWIFCIWRIRPLSNLFISRAGLDWMNSRKSAWVRKMRFISPFPRWEGMNFAWQTANPFWKWSSAFNCVFLTEYFDGILSLGGWCIEKDFNFMLYAKSVLGIR